MLYENVLFHLKIVSPYQIGQAASITGEIVIVPSGTKTVITTWSEISPGYYTHPLTLLAGEYMVNIIVPWESNLHVVSLHVNSVSTSTTVHYGSVI